MKAEGGRMNGIPKTGRRAARVVAALVCFSCFILLPSSVLSAAPSQEDVFRSIQQNVGKTTDDTGKGLGVLAGGAGALILALLVGSRMRRRQSAPKAVNHAGKLFREVLKSVPLKPAELRQLKALAEETRREDSGAEPVENPLTLILCPSVLAKSLKGRGAAKVDRAVIAQVVRKMGAGGEVKSQR